MANYDSFPIIAGEIFRFITLPTLCWFFLCILCPSISWWRSCFRSSWEYVCPTRIILVRSDGAENSESENENSDGLSIERQISNTGFSMRKIYAIETKRLTKEDLVCLHRNGVLKTASTCLHGNGSLETASTYESNECKLSAIEYGSQSCEVDGTSESEVCIVKNGDQTASSFIPNLTLSSSDDTNGSAEESQAGAMERTEEHIHNQQNTADIAINMDINMMRESDGRETTNQDNDLETCIASLASKEKLDEDFDDISMSYMDRSEMTTGTDSDGEVISSSCPICLCEFEEDDIVAFNSSGCRHVFHSECITTW
eukprot:CAMPEP_0194269852 /NCGR_PEP_ID=MMETSP0169-20130528/3965_1 /TAXON_ID=218684 /ORGANISM="Corethron pennatum, Strain L29A3" /LENGTH=313 /DNA_ID=CAMNT_0039011683 /DNA_START=48 /DNA_END=986 /DNA_ORIENTATION=-